MPLSLWNSLWRYRLRHMRSTIQAAEQTENAHMKSERYFQVDPRPSAKIDAVRSNLSVHLRTMQLSTQARRSACGLNRIVDSLFFGHRRTIREKHQGSVLPSGT